MPAEMGCPEDTELWVHHHLVLRLGLVETVPSGTERSASHIILTQMLVLLPTKMLVSTALGIQRAIARPAEGSPGALCWGAFLHIPV